MAAEKTELRGLVSHDVAEAPDALATVKGNPSSAQPMRNLSARAQKLLAPRKSGFCTPIEPVGSGIKRYEKTKASI